MNKYLLMILSILCISSCIYDDKNSNNITHTDCQAKNNKEYKREEGCHLDKMGIKGNVVKVETIVQSTIPLTELFANAFNPAHTISSYIGNVSIEFDNKGNVDNVLGYGIKGDLLFYELNVLLENDWNMSPGVPIGPNAKQKIDNIKTISDADGKVVNVKYYDGDELIWNLTSTYNDDGTPHSIIKQYESMSIKTNFITISYADTTKFNYISYDSLKNWTELEIIYRGVLPKHAHSYKIKRQLTYLNEKEKPLLIDELKHYNQEKNIYTTNTDIVRLGMYGTMKIPHYMALMSNNEVNEVIKNSIYNIPGKYDYIFMSTYDKDDAYANISVNITYGNDPEGYNNLSPEDLRYDKETDKLIEEQQTAELSRSGVYVLKWLPYEFTSISGKTTFKTRYYRYGTGSPIPVYCETYTIPMGDGNVINIIYSFQSNLDYRFRNDFENVIKSILFRK